MPKTASRSRSRGQTEAIKSLGFHADYGCQRTGACCEAPWRVVAQPDAHARISAAFADGRLPGSVDAAIKNEPTLTGDPLHVIQAHGPRGCVFHTGGGCEVRSRVGVEAQPLGCRVFPRIVVKQPRGRFVSLSHFCPTALRLLFREDDAAAAPRNRPAAFPSSDALEGHDARGHLPPLVAPNRPFSWSLFELWEASGAAWLARPDRSPEVLLASWAVVSERIRQRVVDGHRPEDVVKPALARAEREGPGGVLDSVGPRPAATGSETLFLIEAALKLLPEEAGFAAEDLASLRARYLDGDGAARFADDEARHRTAWASFAVPIKRYAAARHFANFHAYQGQGVRTAVLSTVFAVGLVRAFAQAAAGEGGLTRERLERAIRASDFLLLHLVHRPSLAKLFSSIEAASPQDVFRLALGA